MKWFCGAIYLFNTENVIEIFLRIYYCNNLLSYFSINITTVRTRKYIVLYYETLIICDHRKITNKITYHSARETIYYTFHFLWMHDIINLITDAFSNMDHSVKQLMSGVNFIWYWLILFRIIKITLWSNTIIHDDRHAYYDRKYTATWEYHLRSNLTYIDPITKFSNSEG